MARRNCVWKFCPLLKEAAEKCQQDFTLLPPSYQGFPGPDRHVAGKGSHDSCCETVFALAELFPPRVPPACQEPRWGSRGFLHLSHMFTLLHFPVLQPTGGKKSQKPTTKKKLLLEGRKVLSWSLLNLFTLLEGVWCGCAYPLFLLCVLAQQCWCWICSYLTTSHVQDVYVLRDNALTWDLCFLSTQGSNPTPGAHFPFPSTALNITTSNADECTKISVESEVTDFPSLH